jgi:hypothetical protein
MCVRTSYRQMTRTKLMLKVRNGMMMHTYVRTPKWQAYERKKKCKERRFFVVLVLIFGRLSRGYVLLIRFTSFSVSVSPLFLSLSPSLYCARACFLFLFLCFFFLVVFFYSSIWRCYLIILSDSLLSVFFLFESNERTNERNRVSSSYMLLVKPNNAINQVN